jgi:hypothetical protein
LKGNFIAYLLALNLATGLNVAGNKSIETTWLHSRHHYRVEDESREHRNWGGAVNALPMGA